MLDTSNAPIYKNHVLDFSKMREFMGIQPKDLAHLVGVSSATLRNKIISAETTTKAAPIVKIIHYLWELSDHDEDICRRWLREPKERLLGLDPIEFMQLNPKKNIPIIVDDLKRQLYGEVMGA